MAITPLPSAPNSGDPANYNAIADTFVGALPTMVTEINALLPSIAAKLWATAGSSSAANALVLTCGFSALATGMQIRFRATATNTGAATINLDGLGAKACRTVTGVVLPAGYIRTDADTVASYNGTNWVLDRVPETGSNSNGTYCRYADGSQKCALGLQDLTSTAIATASGSVYIGDNYLWTYPAAFSVVWNVGGALSISAEGLHGISVRNISQSAANVRPYSSVSRASGVAKTAYYMADGAWY